MILENKINFLEKSKIQGGWLCTTDFDFSFFIIRIWEYFLILIGLRFKAGKNDFKDVKRTFLKNVSMNLKSDILKNI